MIPRKVHVLSSNAPNPAMFSVVKPLPKSIACSIAPAPWLKNNSIPSRLEYENPDLTQPSVSSF
jgi:hypothetical protein